MASDQLAHSRACGLEGEGELLDLRPASLTRAVSVAERPDYRALSPGIIRRDRSGHHGEIVASLKHGA